MAWQGPWRSGEKSWRGQGCASGIVAGHQAGMDVFCAQTAEAPPSGPSSLVSWHVSRTDLLLLSTGCYGGRETSGTGAGPAKFQSVSVARGREVTHRPGLSGPYELGVGVEFARVCCFLKSSGLCGPQEEVLGHSQRAWLPGVQKEISSVPGWRSRVGQWRTIEQRRQSIRVLGWK